MAKQPNEERYPHGASVRIYKSTHGALGRVAEWYRTSRRELIDALVIDRLNEVNEVTSPQIDAAFRQLTEGCPAERPTLERVVNDLFGLKMKEPEGRGEGREELATSMRVTAATHRNVALLSDWYERFLPYVYEALMMDRLQALHARMADEYAGRKPASGFRTAVKEVLGAGRLADFVAKGGDESDARRRPLKAGGTRARRTRKRAGDAA